MRKGSALLIVLGMISFMLFSGIAFSVYMRQTRLPSSFLRRTTVTRQLSKAALAEAMYDIDRAIGDDPHPGVRRGSSNINYWDHRVLTATSGSYSGNTISTLSLEGLAYLPPALINEARYYSRHTPTASWQKFRFEAGRYAYTAIDVSDYFDINRVFADRPRSSAASRRVTLAHIFEKKGGTGLHGAQTSGEAKAWDTWLSQNVRQVDDNDRISFAGNQMPLVSMADFNLLLGEESFGMIKSPFIDYMNSSGNAFYPDAGDAIDDERAEAYRSMTFVTDSLFRKPSDDELDISDEKNQPFDRTSMENGGTKGFDAIFDKAYSARSELWDEKYCKLLSRLGMCALCDYLDEDSVPLSLAIPTCERNPMICAVRPKIEGVQLAIVKSGDPTKTAELLDGAGKGKPVSADGKTRTVSCWFTYQIDGGKLGQGTAQIDVLALYPFRHHELLAKPGYSIDGQVALFFTLDGDGDIPMVTGNKSDVLGVGDMTLDSAKFDPGAGVIRIPFGRGQKLVIDEDKPTIKKPQILIKLDSLGQQLQSGPNTVNNTYLLRVRRKWTQKNEEDEGSPAKWLPELPPENAEIAECTTRFPIINRSGKPISDKDMLQHVKDKRQLRLNMALWLRVLDDKTQKTVDLAPAWMKDDQLNGLNWNTENARIYCSYYGMGTHFLKYRFLTGESDLVLSLSPGALDKEPVCKVSLESKTLVCADPRYNHSPYNWFAVDEGDVEKAWKDNCNCTGNGRDGDCYMATSDQGYLQSIYELAFIPRTAEPHESPGADAFGGLKKIAGRQDVNHPSGFDGCLHAENMWKTYCPYEISGVGKDLFDKLKFTPGINGVMVNPYSDSAEVLAAAFANTPAEWRVASTNFTVNQLCDLPADEFNKKYAWNAYGATKTRLPWAALQDLAEDFRDEVREDPLDWENAFGNLWRGDGHNDQCLAGIDLSNIEGAKDTKITSVDRKFLYGFWHDSFAVNQQLFLIFVRAEPMMMGGGVAGNAPPQLSSRAVALVWRDPTKRKVSGQSSGSSQSDAYIPHAMRILFYHPLD